MTNEYEGEDRDLDVGENQGVEEDPIFAFLNDKPNDGAEDEDDMSDLDAEDGDSVEVLRAKLKARNHIIRQRDKAIKRMQKENEQGAQKKGIGSEDIAELIRVARGDKETQADDADDIDKLKEQFEENPSAIVDLMLQREARLEQKLADVLQRRDQYFMGQLGKSKENQIPKEIRDLAEKLGTHPDYQGWSSEQLLTVAKTLKPYAKRVERSPAMTGSRPLAMTASNTEVEKVSKSALEAMGYYE